MSRARDERSVVVSATGFLASVWLAIEDAALKGGLSKSHLHFLATEEARWAAKPIGKAVSAIVRMFVEAADFIFTVLVDYGQSLSQMIQAGEYDSVDENFKPEYFQISGSGMHKVSLTLVKYDKEMDTNQILGDLKARGLRSATLAELLAFGRRYRKHYHFVIVALDAIGYIGTDTHTAYIASSPERRKLDLFQNVSLWPGRNDCYFLVARGSKSLTLNDLDMFGW